MPDTANTPEGHIGQLEQPAAADPLAPAPPQPLPPPAPVETPAADTQPPKPEPEPDDQSVTARRRTIAGVVVVIIGLFFLAEQFWGSFWDWGRLWPVILIAVGVYLLLRSRRQ